MIELLVMIAIAGILAGIAAPGFIGFLNNQRMREATSELFNVLNQTKSRARKEKTPYFVAFRNFPTSNGFAQYSVPFPINSSVDLSTYNCSGLVWRNLGTDDFPLQFDMDKSTFATLSDCTPTTRRVTFDKNGFTFDKNGFTTDQDRRDIRFFLRGNPGSLRCIRSRYTVGTLVLLDGCPKDLDEDEE
ncbi:MAG: Tfp pilus assembly protein FimT/FimU [Pseudanabaenaceae cyanobacterium]